MKHMSNIKQACWLSKQAVGASKHVICANMKIITIWVSGNNRSYCLDLDVDVYARDGDQVLNPEEFKVLKLPSFSI